MRGMKSKAPASGYRISDELWAKIEPLIPPPNSKPHPLGCHRPRVPNRQVMDGIFFVLRTGCQWNALNATGICSSSTAHRRFQEWRAAGLFEQLWRLGLEAYDEAKGLNWSWLAMDGAMTKAPLGGKGNRSQSNRSGQTRRKTQHIDRGQRHPGGGSRSRRESGGLQDD